MSVIITGTVIHNLGKTSVALTEADGPQTFSKELEAQLVSEGAAKYVEDKPLRIEPPKKAPSKGVATAAEGESGQGTSDNIPKNEVGSEVSENDRKIPEYGTYMKVTELREIMEECGLIYKVGMSKVDMVAALDAYFEDEDEDIPPDLGAEDPVI